MTDERLTEDFLHSAVCGMIEPVRTSQGFELTLPQIYHTGHSTVVVVAEVPNGFLIHDNSYAAMLVSQFGHSISDNDQKHLRQAMESYGCDLDGLKVVRRCAALREVAVSAVLVGCASRLIADQLLNAPQQPVFDFTTRMVTKVTEVVGKSRIRTNQEVRGHLGAKYHMTAVVLDTRESKPIAFLEPVNGKDAVARKFKEFYDLSKTEAHFGVDRVAILNDTKKLPSSDILLLQEVSNPVRFSDAATRFASWATPA